MNVEQAAKQLEALGNTTRLQVYRALVRAGEAGLPVGQIQERLKVPSRGRRSRTTSSGSC
jgi:ArsR family transcriptional regulator, arsenate/arsenite/antimonite-responsive transcriptional repressor